MATSPPTRPVRNRWGLTGRGWWFLGTGLTVVAVGILMRWTPIAQLGALVALLPLAARLLTRAPRGGVVLDRQLSARELASGDQLTVSVGVRSHLRRDVCLLVEDAADAELGGSHRFAVRGGSGEGVSHALYRLGAGARGLHGVGPMRLHLIDRFGMVHRVVPTGAVDEVVVHPPVVRLDPRPLSGAAVGSGSGHLGARGAAADDVIPREYRAGDEVRRIDWKASARLGHLMVRSEENPWRAAVTVVVDVQEADHRGVEPDSSLAAALSMTASIGCLALEQGWDLTVVTTDDVLLFSGSPISGMALERRALLLALATVPSTGATFPAPSLPYTTGSTAGPLVLVAGHLDHRQAEQLASIGSHTPTRVLVSVLADQWEAAGYQPGDRTPLATPDSGPPGLGAFSLAGWRQVEVARAEGGTAARAAALGQAWEQVVRAR